MDKLRLSCPEALSLVAVDEGQVVGHIFFSPVQVEARSRTIQSMGLAPMAVLPERQRQVFILREWRGLSIRETAQTLGCSENSIKQHHFRAMRTLRKQLAEVWTHAQPTTS